MLFTHTFSLSHDNLSVSMLQRKNRRLRQGKIICLGCWGKKLSPHPASTLAIPPLEKGSRARKHWAISGVWRKILMPEWWGTTGSFPTPAGKWRLSTIAGKRLHFPPTSKTLTQRHWFKGTPWNAVSKPWLCDRLSSIRTSMYFTVPPCKNLASIERTWVSQYSRQVCASGGGSCGLGKAVGTDHALWHQPVHFPSPLIVTINF